VLAVQKPGGATDDLGFGRGTGRPGRFKEAAAASITTAAREARVSFPTASAALRRLERLGIVREITG
jgi:hypothetical protein